MYQVLNSTKKMYLEVYAGLSEKAVESFDKEITKKLKFLETMCPFVGGTTFENDRQGKIEAIKEIIHNNSIEKRIAKKSKAKTKYEIEICRTGYGFRTITVEAHSYKEAKELALNEAGEHDYNEKSSEYDIV